MSPPRIESSPMGQRYEIITHPPRISRLLREIHDDRALVTLIPDEGNRAFSTAILDDAGNYEGAHLTLDELVPRDGNTLVGPHTHIWLLGQLKGVKFAFESEIIENGSDQGIPYHVVSLPRAIRYEQRRTSFRVAINFGIKAHIQLNDRISTHPLTGQLRDLSVGGVSALLPLINETTLVPGTLLTECEVELPGEGKILATTEIRHVHPVADQGNAKVGMAFRNLSPEAERQVQRSVRFLEREQMRKQTDDNT